MDIQQFLRESAEKDPTWQTAQELVRRYLPIPGPLVTLVRNGMAGLLGPDEFIKQLGFVGLNPSSLINAANMPTDGTAPSIASLQRALNTLGIEYATAVIAINAAVRMILKNKPGLGWRTLLEEMMTEIEIGDKLGARALQLGSTRGVVVGFSRTAGLGILLARDAKVYMKWRTLQSQRGKVGTKLVLEFFGCEPYQVSALLIQALGFGSAAAFGALCGLGNLNPKHVELGEEVEVWRAALAWIDALAAGRGYPGPLPLRNYFNQIAPPKEASQKNVALETLYAEIARVRREGSQLLWHLPRPSYERTKEAYELP